MKPTILLQCRVLSAPFQLQWLIVILLATWVVAPNYVHSSVIKELAVHELEAALAFGDERIVNPSSQFHSRLSLSRPSRHVYADGFVERACSIVIRDGVARGEYFIGFNERTALQWLEHFQKAKDSADSPQSDVDSSSPSSEPEAEVTGQQLKTPSKQKPQGGETGEGEHLTDPQVIEKFADLSECWFSEALRVSIDGKRVNLKNVKVTGDARHPFSIMVTFEFPIEVPRVDTDRPNPGQPAIAAKPILASLKIEDRTFLDETAHGAEPKESPQGAVRYALRGKGSTMLSQSNVASVLARSDRIELQSLDSKEIAASMSINAKVLITLK